MFLVIVMFVYLYQGYTKHTNILTDSHCLLPIRHIPKIGNQFLEHCSIASIQVKFLVHFC